MIMHQNYKIKQTHFLDKLSTVHWWFIVFGLSLSFISLVDACVINCVRDIPASLLRAWAERGPNASSWLWQDGAQWRCRRGAARWPAAGTCRPSRPRSSPTRPSGPAAITINYNEFSLPFNKINKNCQIRWSIIRHLTLEHDVIKIILFYYTKCSLNVNYVTGKFSIRLKPTWLVICITLAVFCWGCATLLSAGRVSAVVLW